MLDAIAESFFASLEFELIERRSFKTKTEARHALFTYIEGWYNPRRRHSAIDYRSPATFERLHRETLEDRRSRPDHDLPTVGASETGDPPTVDKSAERLTESG